METQVTDMTEVLILIEWHFELYRALLKADTSRRLVAADLFSKNIISEPEYDKIKEIEKLHGADESTDEILRRIRAHLSIFPTNTSKVLEVLGREEALTPIVMSMKMKLHIPTPSSEAYPQSTEHETGTWPWQ